MADGLMLVRELVRREMGEDPGDDAARCREYFEALATIRSAAHDTLMATLLDELAIWLPVEVYRDLPVLLPHVARDNACRKQQCTLGHRKRSKGRIGELRDVWSTPSPDGYVRDDNTLIKNLASGLCVESSGPLRNAQVARNYVACHVWRMADARDPWLNSFVPNLVWLPQPLNVLSDRAGHLVQDLLRERARAVFSATATVSPGIADNLWAALPLPPRRRLAAININTFRATPSWSMLRARKVHRVGCLLQALCAGTHGDYTSGHSHYDLHLRQLEPRRVRPLAHRLDDYCSEINLR